MIHDELTPELQSVMQLVLSLFPNGKFQTNDIHPHRSHQHVSSTHHHLMDLVQNNCLKTWGGGKGHGRFFEVNSENNLSENSPSTSLALVADDEGEQFPSLEGLAPQVLVEIREKCRALKEQCLRHAEAHELREREVEQVIQRQFRFLEQECRR